MAPSRVRRSMATRSYLHPHPFVVVVVVFSVSVSFLLNRHSAAFNRRRNRRRIRPRLGELETPSGGVDEDSGEAEERERVEEHVSQDEEGVAPPTSDCSDYYDDGASSDSEK